MQSKQDPARVWPDGARKLLDRLRHGPAPGDKEARRLTEAHVVDALRHEITSDDLQWLWIGIHAASEARAGFYLSLLKPLAEDDDVHHELLTMWRTAGPRIRFHLMWPILDRRDLGEDTHREIFEFVNEHWNIFMPRAAQFLGTPDSIIPRVIRRLGDPLFPESKSWVFLCCLPEYANDQETAKALVRVGLKMRPDFTGAVAQRLLSRFFPDERPRARDVRAAIASSISVSD